MVNKDENMFKESHHAALTRSGPPRKQRGARTAPTTEECRTQAICFGPKPGSYGIERQTAPVPIIAAIDAKTACNY